MAHEIADDAGRLAGRLERTHKRRRNEQIEHDDEHERWPQRSLTPSLRLLGRELVVVDVVRRVVT